MYCTKAMDRFVARLDDDQSSSSKTTRRKRQYVDNVGSSIYPSSSLPLPIFPSLLGEKLSILGGSFPPLPPARFITQPIFITPSESCELCTFHRIMNSFTSCALLCYVWHDNNTYTHNPCLNWYKLALLTPLKKPSLLVRVTINFIALPQL